MEKAKLPCEHASEPNEEAHQPLAGVAGALKTSTAKSSREKNDKNFSQNSCSTYKEALSQPMSYISHKERLQWLQRRRALGLWAQCDTCQRWRHLPEVLDSHELPDKWYCSMNPDKNMADCSIPEARLKVADEEELIHNSYSAGSLVWARTPGWPRWPAMVDDEPDTEQFYWLDGFSDIPTHYNVVFFDTAEVTRAWVTPENMLPYIMNKRHVINEMKFKKRIEAAMKQANDAANLPLDERLAKYSFIARYTGPVRSPIKVDRKVLERYQRKLQKKFNVDFPIESSSESENDEPQSGRAESLNKTTDNSKQAKGAKSAAKRKMTTNKIVPELENAEVIHDVNVISVGTPKRSKNIIQRNILKESIENDESNVSNDDGDKGMSNDSKEPDSLAVQLCHSELPMVTTSMENTDKSNNKETATTMPETITTANFTCEDTEIQPPSPNSDDFDF